MAGTRQAMQRARVRRGSDIGAACSTSPERPALLVIRFMAMSPPRPSRKAGIIGQSRFDSVPCAGAE